MAIAYTTRLALAKPDQDEFQLVGVLNNNNDILDKAASARTVADNITPPINELYDGAIIHESNSGRTWIAVANLAGSFDKHYIAGATKLYQAALLTGTSGVIVAPGSNIGFSAQMQRGTVNYNRLFHVSWALTITAAVDQSNIIQAEAWFNSVGMAYDRHTAVPGTFSGETYISCNAGSPALLQGVLSKVGGTGGITWSNDYRFTHFQFTETAVA